MHWRPVLRHSEKAVYEGMSVVCGAGGGPRTSVSSALSPLSEVEGDTSTRDTS